MTGLHRVCDIHCKTCMKIIGWTYVIIIHLNLNFKQVFAYETSEKYKEGKFIVERALIKKFKETEGKALD